MESKILPIAELLDHLYQALSISALVKGNSIRISHQQAPGILHDHKHMNQSYCILILLEAPA